MNNIVLVKQTSYVNRYKKKPQLPIKDKSNK